MGPCNSAKSFRALRDFEKFHTYRNDSFSYLLTFVSVQESFSRKKHFLKNSQFFYFKFLVSGQRQLHVAERLSQNKCRQQQNFHSDPKEAWHYNHVTFTPIAKTFMLYCRLIYMLSILYVRLMIKVKVGIPESFKVGWYSHKITGSSNLKFTRSSTSGSVKFV